MYDRARPLSARHLSEMRMLALSDECERRGERGLVQDAEGSLVYLPDSPRKMEGSIKLRT